MEGTKVDINPCIIFNNWKFTLRKIKHILTPLQQTACICHIQYLNTSISEQKFLPYLITDFHQLNEVKFLFGKVFKKKKSIKNTHCKGVKLLKKYLKHFRQRKKSVFKAL